MLANVVRRASKCLLNHDAGRFRIGATFNENEDKIMTQVKKGVIKSQYC
jgi:hypothetical protein